MVVTPEKAAEACAAVIDRFDGMIPRVLQSRGSLPTEGSKGSTATVSPARFPIMTISIAIVICQKGAYDSAVSVAKAAAEMKDHLKGKDGSNYSINRRIQPR